jgi:hypothetical protein
MIASGGKPRGKPLETFTVFHGGRRPPFARRAGGSRNRRVCPVFSCPAEMTFVNNDLKFPHFHEMKFPIMNV